MIDNREKNNKSKLILIIIILVLMVMVISATYAYFMLLISKEEDSTKLYTGTLDVKYTQNNIIYGDLFYPRSEPNNLNDDNFTYVNSFSITNTGTLDGYIRISLDVRENEFPDESLKYKIYNKDGNIFMNGSLSSLDSYVLVDNLFIRSGENVNYSIQIWLEENGKQQNKSEDKKFVAAIEVDEKQIIE